jgi:hypothetical protein
MKDLILEVDTLTRLSKKRGMKFIKKLEKRTYRKLIERNIIKGKGMIADTTLFPTKIPYSNEVGYVNTIRECLVNKIKTIGKMVGRDIQLHSRKARRAYLMRIDAESGRRSRSFLRRLATAGLAINVLTLAGVARPAASPPAEVGTGIAFRYQNVISLNRVRALTVLPDETVTFEVLDRNPGSGYVTQPAGGQLVPLGTGRWEWKSPSVPGLYPIKVVAADGEKSVMLQAFVVVPFDKLRDGFLNGYRIGHYPEKPLHGLADYKSPVGFIEVTRENEDVLVSPHFRLKQFLCKQPAGARKYVVLNERLLLALEYILKRVNEAGYRATTFKIMSGYRTPAYNTSLGNVHYSMHQWGAAAVISEMRRCSIG